MQAPPRQEFFIGWSKKLPERLKVFVPVTALVLFLLFPILALAIGGTKEDPGDGRFIFKRETVQGILTNDPYPTVFVTQGNDSIAEGRTLMLAGGGKRGVQGRAVQLEGKLVEISGVMLKRGELDMMQLRGGRNGLKAVEGEALPVEDVDLGQWRIFGEVCDGKCLAGAMRPGTGLAHKACANLCLIGGVPPVLVSTAPVEGSEFMLMADQNGEAFGDELYEWVARIVALEGRLVKRGDLLIFETDLSNAVTINAY